METGLTVAFCQEIENLETLTALEELWLGKNKITEMKVRDKLHSRTHTSNAWNKPIF